MSGTWEAIFKVRWEKIQSDNYSVIVKYDGEDTHGITFIEDLLQHVNVTSDFTLILHFS